MDATLNSQQLVRLSRRRQSTQDRGCTRAGRRAVGGCCDRRDHWAVASDRGRCWRPSRQRRSGPGGHRWLLVDRRCVSAGARAEAPASPPSAHPDQPDDVARVLDLAFADGKLVQWPSKRSKRLIVLDHLAQQFDIGKRYKEADVNDLLRPFNDDVATSVVTLSTNSSWTAATATTGAAAAPSNNESVPGGSADSNKPRNPQADVSAHCRLRRRGRSGLTAPAPGP